MIKCQDSGATCLDRHPAIFARVRLLVEANKTLGVPPKILSFGCSTGEEVRSLKALGGRPGNWDVHGAEIQSESLRQARASDPGGTYVSDASGLPKNSYDAVFAMSVLCRYRAPATDFPFETFQQVLQLIVDLLRPGGYLVLYNSQYDPRETSVAQRELEAIENDEDAGGSGFVPKFDKDMTREIPATLADAVPYLYRKKQRTSEPAITKP